MAKGVLMKTSLLNSPGPDSFPPFVPWLDRFVAVAPCATFFSGALVNSYPENTGALKAFQEWLREKEHTCLEAAKAGCGLAWCWTLRTGSGRTQGADAEVLSQLPSVGTPDCATESLHQERGSQSSVPPTAAPNLCRSLQHPPGQGRMDGWGSL